MHRISGSDLTDPDFAPVAEEFDHLTAADIHRGVQALDPRELTAGAQAWQQASSGLATAIQQAHNDIRGALDGGWCGSAADTAAQAIADFERWGRHLSEVMDEVSARLTRANDAAENLRAAVGAPSTAQPDLDGALLDPQQAVTNTDTQKDADHQRQDLVRVMNSVYLGAFLAAGSGVPAFSDVPVPDTAPAPVARMGSAGPRHPGPGEQSPAGSAQAGTPVIAASGSPAVEVPVVPQVPDGSGSNAVVPQPDRSVAGPGVVVPGVAPGAASPSVVTPGTTTPAAAAPGATAQAPAATTPRVTADGEPSAATRPNVAEVPARQAERTRSSGTDAHGDEPSQRKDAHHDSDQGTTDTVTGVGAGMVGGLAGGVLVAEDATHRTSSPAAAARRDHAEDYDDEYDIDPAEPDPSHDLIGPLTAPMPTVLGEWSDDE